MLMKQVILFCLQLSRAPRLLCIIGSDCNRNDADGAVSNEASVISYDSNVRNYTPAAFGSSEQVEVEEFEDSVEIVHTYIHTYILKML